MTGFGRQDQQRWDNNDWMRTTTTTTMGNLHLLNPPLVVLLPQPLGHVVPVPVDRLGQLLLLVLDPPLDHLHISLPISLISFFVNQSLFHWKTNLSNRSKTIILAWPTIVLSLVQFLETTLLTTISLRKDQCRLNLSNTRGGGRGTIPSPSWQHPTGPWRSHPSDPEEAKVQGFVFTKNIWKST